MAPRQQRLLLRLLACCFLPALHLPAPAAAAAGAASSPGITCLPTAKQYYLHFGSCWSGRQNQTYGNWHITMPPSQPHSSSLTLYLDTKNSSAVSPCFGFVDPLFFPIRHLYFAYFDVRGVQSAASSTKPYVEASSYYTIRLNGVLLTTVRDLKDVGVGQPYSLKAMVDGRLLPSPTVYTVEIAKVRASAAIPDPASVFISPDNEIVYSYWTVNQALTVNGAYVNSHAWCPVLTLTGAR